MTAVKPQRPYITCRELIDFLADYLTNELPPEQRFEFERHLAVCPSCINYLETYRQTLRLGRQVLLEADVMESMPEELVHSILSTCRSEL